MTDRLEHLTAGMPIVWGGDKLSFVSAELAASFRPGDRLIVMQQTGALLHLPSQTLALADAAVTRAEQAFTALAATSDAEISDFFARFADHLRDETVWNRIAAANDSDVTAARAAGRSTTRLRITPGMREQMISGLEAWRDAPSGRDRVVEQIQHEGWRVELATAPLGVVGFVFEGRPNVFADAAGVIRGGNAAVFRKAVFRK